MVEGRIAERYDEHHLGQCGLQGYAMLGMLKHPRFGGPVLLPWTLIRRSGLQTSHQLEKRLFLLFGLNSFADPPRVEHA